MRQDDGLEQSADTLSSIGRQLLRLDAADVYSKLVVTGGGNAAALPILESIRAGDLLDAPVVSSDDAAAVLAGLWLRHDWLDQSHRVSQQIDTPVGSWWHAIMHRREGDFSNSKYWYARTAGHTLFSTLAARAADVVNPFPADKSVFRILSRGWDSAAFVDLVQQVHENPDDPRHRLCVSLQQIEWHVLFEHSTRAATGR